MMISVYQSAMKTKNPDSATLGMQERLLLRDMVILNTRHEMPFVEAAAMADKDGNIAVQVKSRVVPSRMQPHGVQDGDMVHLINGGLCLWESVTACSQSMFFNMLSHLWVLWTRWSSQIFKIPPATTATSHMSSAVISARPPYHCYARFEHPYMYHICCEGQRKRGLSRAGALGVCQHDAARGHVRARARVVLNARTACELSLNPS